MEQIKNPVAYARFAGFNYLLIFALAIFANFYVLGGLVVSGDPVTTLANISAKENLYRIGVAAFFLVLVCDVFISWAFYLLFRPANAHLSLLAALFRLAYTVAQIGVALNLVSVLSFLDEPALAGAFDGLQEAAWPYFFLVGHETGFTLTLIFFGVHLALLGSLIVRSSLLPALIGALVAIAGCGYVIDGFGELLFPDYWGVPNASLYIVMLPALVGEGALMLWLLIMGVNKQQWNGLAAT